MTDHPYIMYTCTHKCHIFIPHTDPAINAIHSYITAEKLWIFKRMSKSEIVCFRHHGHTNYSYFTVNYQQSILDMQQNELNNQE